MAAELDKATDVSDSDAVKLAKIRQKAELWEQAIGGITRVLSIVSFGVPLYIVYLTVRSLANQNTQVSPALAYTVAAMVGGTSALAGLAKFFGQRRELIRQRTRIDELEARVERLKKRGTRR